MKILNFLLITLFFFSSSRDIIKNLPYNIYQIEDMNQYETKYLTEGNKFYIKLPKNIEKDTIFYLTIPKNVTLFPIYSSDFKEKPKDEEIINTDYKNEIQLKNKENEEYSIYSFNIEKSDSYKVLYFQNNEALNYLSLFASDLKETIPTYRTLEYNSKHSISLSPREIQFFKIQLVPEDEDLIIELEAYYTSYHYYPDFSLGYSFFNNPNDSDITNPSRYGNEPFSSVEYGTYQIRKYEFKNNMKYKYLGIRIYNKIDLGQNISIILKPVSKLPVWAIILIVIGSIIFLIITAICLSTKEGREICACLLIIFICCSSSRR